MKKKILTGIGVSLGVIAVLVLFWAVLYLAVPNVKDNTDKIFKWNDYAVEDTVEDENKDEATEDETEDETNEDEAEALQVVLNENMTEVKIIA